MSVELPKDAEGREIPLDTVALFNRDGNVYSIVRWTFTTDFDLSDGWSNKWRAITDRGFALDPALVYLTTPEPDTWEKLERTWTGASRRTDFVRTTTRPECVSNASWKAMAHVMVTRMR